MMQALRTLVLIPLTWLTLVGADAWQVWHATPSAPDCRAETALVMGAAQYDGEPSPALRRRLDRALELYRSGCVERLVVSGGSQPGDRFSEGESGVRYLEEHGVPTAALASEPTARNSVENLAHSAPLLGNGALLIVTDELHAHRTAWLAKRLDLDADVVSVPVPEGRLRYGLRELLILTALRFGVLGV
jgi:vancomycin permeability regulator SanA